VGVWVSFRECTPLILGSDCPDDFDPGGKDGVRTKIIFERAWGGTFPERLSKLSSSDDDA